MHTGLDTFNKKDQKEEYSQFPERAFIVGGAADYSSCNVRKVESNNYAAKRPKV